MRRWTHWPPVARQSSQPSTDSGSCAIVPCRSPSRHATAHFHGTAHPIVRSFEPGEDWFYCYADDLAFEIDGAGPAPSHS